MSDFELKILKRVRFCEKIIYLKSHLSPPHIFFTTFSSIEPCTITAHNIRQLDNSIRRRSNNTSCTHFRKDFEL